MNTNDRWQRHRRQLINIASTVGTPTYVYDQSLIEARYKELQGAFAYERLRIYYACKANTNPAILKVLKSCGAGIECVSKGEVEAALKAGFNPKRILYTCSYAETSELQWVLKQGVHITADSLRQIEKIGQLRPGTKLSVRINQGIGAGHHSHVITGGPDSKFGIDLKSLPQIAKIATKYRLTITGVQQHIGSNVLDDKTLVKAISVLLKTSTYFPALNHIDLGGGFGVPYKPGEKALDLKSFKGKTQRLFNSDDRLKNKLIAIYIEPGRYLVAEAGMLLATVTEIKTTAHKTFIGLNTGLNHLIRPAMYDSYHEVVNLSGKGDKRIKAHIAGNICESGDILGKGRSVIKPKEGDIIGILNAGAYGYSMSSHYNSRKRPAEVMIKGNTYKVVRKAE